MILTVFGSTNESGVELVNQALYKGHTVKAFGRNVFMTNYTESDQLQLITGALFDKTQVLKAVKGSDAVFCTVAASDDSLDHTLSLGIKNIAEQMEKAGVKRLIALGNSGILKVSRENEDMIMDREDYPPEKIPIALENLKAFHTLAKSSLSWTLLCASEIKTNPPTGVFRTSLETLPPGTSSEIFTGDLALCMINELERDDFSNFRVGISR